MARAAEATVHADPAGEVGPLVRTGALDGVERRPVPDHEKLAGADLDRQDGPAKRGRERADGRPARAVQLAQAATASGRIDATAS